MKAKLLLLLCCLFAIEGWANSNDIHLLKDSRSNPMGIPIQPTYEKCAILSNILNVSFGRAKDYAIITVTNKATGEIVHSKTYHNTSIVMIDMSSCEKGEYTIHIILNDCLLKVHLLYSETELNKVMDKCTFSLSDRSNFLCSFSV